MARWSKTPERGRHGHRQVNGAARRRCAQPQRHAPDAQGAARGAGRTCSRRARWSNADKHPLRLRAQRAGHRRSRSARSSAIVNAEIPGQHRRRRAWPIDEAQKLGAMMLFGEKIRRRGARARHRLVSRELCGGTTCNAPATSACSRSWPRRRGRRHPRVEAVTGDNALAYLQQPGRHREPACRRAEGRPAGCHGRPPQALEQVRALEKEVAALKGKLASAGRRTAGPAAVDVKGLKVLAAA